MIEKCFKINEVIKVGQTIAIIETDSEIKTTEAIIEIDQKNDSNTENNRLENKNIPQDNVSNKENDIAINDSSNNRFYSPLVKNIIKKEKITDNELQLIKGTGKKNRITKTKIQRYGL